MLIALSEVEVLGQRILCASTKQSSMLRTRGTSGAVRAQEVRKGPIRKAGEVQSADNAEQAVVGAGLNRANAHCPSSRGVGSWGCPGSDPGSFPPSCADLSAERKLQPLAVAV